MRATLDRFREQALASGIPAADVERWLGLARRRSVLAENGDGPIVGRFGGPVMLPPHVAYPTAWPDIPQRLIASIDLAALPGDATDLPLPPDGHLLLFADPDLLEPVGDAVYIPAGTAVEERQVDYDELTHAEELDRFRLRLSRDASLPDYTMGANTTIDTAEHPRAGELRDVWRNNIGFPAGSWLQLGGHAKDFEGNGDPVLACARLAAEAEEQGQRPAPAEPSQLADWVLLAQWEPGVKGLEDASMYWAITRQDLAARRIDRVSVTMIANP